MSNPNDEAAIATDAFQSFVKEWGDMNILYNRLVLEIFLEELFEAHKSPNNKEDHGRND